MALPSLYFTVSDIEDRWHSFGEDARKVEQYVNLKTRDGLPRVFLVAVLHGCRNLYLCTDFQEHESEHSAEPYLIVGDTLWWRVPFEYNPDEKRYGSREEQEEQALDFGEDDLRCEGLMDEVILAADLLAFEKKHGIGPSQAESPAPVVSGEVIEKLHHAAKAFPTQFPNYKSKPPTMDKIRRWVIDEFKVDERAANTFKTIIKQTFDL